MDRAAPDTTSTHVLRTYYALTLISTLAASFIWGINTLFLLDAGLNAAQAFTVNAFYTVGQVLFEVPTGVVADTRGRRVSYLWGAVILLASTLLYLWMWQIEAPLWGWALPSILLGLGFTFFSGAVEAWLVDALKATGHEGDLDTVFGRAQTVNGIAMLVGSVGGGVIAQFTNLGVPYLLRAVMLGLLVFFAATSMRDIGFRPVEGESVVGQIKMVWRGSIDSGFRVRPVRWVMLAAPFTMGAGIFAFYAMQPYLLELFGDERAYGIAGVAAAVVAGSQIAGGMLVAKIRAMFRRRTDALILGVIVASGALVLIGLVDSFWIALGLLVIWALVFAATGPIRQAYLNGLIPSEQRATVLSFQSLMGSAGGVVTQPALGRAADVWSFSTSYVITGVIAAVAVPFVALARREKAPSDPIEVEPA